MANQDASQKYDGDGVTNAKKMLTDFHIKSSYALFQTLRLSNRAFIFRISNFQ